MLKKILTGAALLALLPGCALAETWQGVTVATETVAIAAEARGTLETLNVEAGQRVQAGDLLGVIQTVKVYAEQDGTVATLDIAEGDRVEDAALEIAPESKYVVYCTVDGASSEAENQFVHSGETVYVYCTADGTHRGVGIVTKIDGEEYRVEMLGGEMYIGETVYLYRMDEFLKKDRVGKGTVVSSETVTYAANGRITAVHVEKGEFVMRGELLFEYVEGDSTEILCKTDGIATEVAVAPGDKIEDGQLLVSVVPDDAVCVEIHVDEKTVPEIHAGDSATLIFAADPMEQEIGGTVRWVSQISENGTYAVWIDTDVGSLRLGTSASVRIDLK